MEQFAVIYGKQPTLSQERGMSGRETGAAGALSLGARVFFLSQTRFSRLYFLTLWSREGAHNPPPWTLTHPLRLKFPSLLGLLNGKAWIRSPAPRIHPSRDYGGSYPVPSTPSIRDVIQSRTAREPLELGWLGAVGAGCGGTHPVPLPCVVRAAGGMLPSPALCRVLVVGI